MKLIVMNKVQLDRFNEMYDSVKQVKKALLGDDEFQREGLIETVAELKKRVGDIEDFQDKQKLFAGWTGWVLRLAIISISTLITWAITYLSIK